ncbi:muts domain V-domain-containing protein, partial [Lasiosphaeria ovina]
EDKDRLICAISESRSSDVLGLAVINVTAGQVDIITILNDDKYQRLFETLWRIQGTPEVFLVLKNVVSKNSKSRLASNLDNEFPDVPILPQEREHWNELEAHRLIDLFSVNRQAKATRDSLGNSFYGSCAFAAAMTYVREELNIFFSKQSLVIRHSQPADAMGIDRSTIMSLELLYSIRGAKTKSSTLFGVLNYTRTPQGRRLLRSTMLQPSTKKEEILGRYDALQALCDDEDLFQDVSKGLKGLTGMDVERSIPWVRARPALEEGVSMIQGHYQIFLPVHAELYEAERELNNILMLRRYIAGVQNLHRTVGSAHCASSIIDSILEKFSLGTLGPVVQVLIDSIEEDATYSNAPIDIRNNRLWAVKAEPNGILERARKLFRRRVDELNEYVDRLNDHFTKHLGMIAELCMDNDKDRHYHLRFHWEDVKYDVSRRWREVETQKFGQVYHCKQYTIGGVPIVNGVRRKKHYYCQTIELLERSREIQLQADIVTTQSDRLVLELKDRLLRHAPVLLAMSDAVAKLDMLCSFADLSTSQNYVRPIIADSLVLKAARNPITEIRKANFVANDVFSGKDGQRFLVITGGNMSGKSTFIRTIALVQIMAQMGCFVPARYAGIPICDRIFTRVSTEDRPEGNLGTFGVEMREMNVILRKATKDSLVIIDELGRGTSHKDGLAIALSMSESLIDIGCRVFFATHFSEIARVLNSSKPKSVLNVHFEGRSVMSTDTAQISLPHRLSSGPVEETDYGLDLSRRFFPPRIVRNAEKVSGFLQSRQIAKEPGPMSREAKQNKLILALPDLLKQAHGSNMDDSALESYLERLQTEFTVRMDEVADDDALRDTTNTPRSAEKPVLDKPDEDELINWKKKCDEGEKRVMRAHL